MNVHFVWSLVVILCTVLAVCRSTAGGASAIDEKS
jgi:predicted small secreted protein